MVINTSVQAIGKHKHIIFRHQSNAVDSTACHNINKTVFTKQDKAYENYFCGIFRNIVKKWKKNVFLANIIFQKMEKCEK